ncbi:MAG: fumarylacetoacetase [Frankiales bacterium]|nr:fumarylacetoacetase [Frankiales bacterium]
MMGTWVPGADGSGFGVAHLPYGVVSHAGGHRELAVRIGDQALSLARLHDAGLLDGLLLHATGVFDTGSLDGLLARGPQAWALVRERLQSLLTDPDAQDRARAALLPLGDVSVHLPWTVADYVDFYSSEHHATNVGRIFRPDGDALTPNWKHLPIGYHGRAGTVMVSGTDVVRPSGQRKAPDEEQPTFGPCRRLDVEVEVGFVVGTPSPQGTAVAADAFTDHVFGVVLLNDWSARDIQAWEYVPLGPFLGKSFATSVSAWVTPLAALAAARVPPPVQDPVPLPYLADPDPWSLDLRLSLALERGGSSAVVSRPPFAGMYWTPGQQLAHLTVNGASLRTGDLFASGTVSGAQRDERGSFLELAWGGREPLPVEGVGEVAFLEDGDVVTIRGEARATDGGMLSLGEVVGRVVAAR